MFPLGSSGIMSFPLTKMLHCPVRKDRMVMLLPLPLPLYLLTTSLGFLSDKRQALDLLTALKDSSLSH